jgi:hypothetical protein
MLYTFDDLRKVLTDVETSWKHRSEAGDKPQEEVVNAGFDQPFKGIGDERVDRKGEVGQFFFQDFFFFLIDVLIK